MFEMVSNVVKNKLKAKQSKINVNELLINLIEKYPGLQDKLFEYSPLFEKLRDPWIFNLVAKNISLKKLFEYVEADVEEFLQYYVSGKKINDKNITANSQMPDWVLKYEFEEIDARKLSGFFLKEILKKEASLDKNKGLKIIQNFHAAPLISLLESKGYKSYTNKKTNDLFEFYFIKDSRNEKSQKINFSLQSKPTMVVQSATPVVFPILLKLLESERVKNAVDITEYKVWEETEKHLGWLVNGKADLSFSAILAMSNLVNNKDIVKLTSITVWDNFYLLTRNFVAKSWNELKNKEIHMPLFFNAPPAKVTKYLMKKAGFNPDEFNFVFGKPFGRPEEIYRKLVEGKIEVALLREPEVSYALVNNPEINVSFSYNDLWKQIHHESMGLPNAGVVFKREWLENYPKEAQILMEEIDRATNWVKNNPADAARLSYNKMGHSYNEVYQFLTRVHYQNVHVQKVKQDITDYLSVIEGKNKAETAIEKMLA